MPVIPFPQRHRNGAPAPVRPLNREARIHGTFRSPRGGLGTMAGSLRLDRFHVISDRLCAAGVFTGEPPPGLVPAIAPVVAPVASAVALKRRHLGSRS